MASLTELLDDSAIDADTEVVMAEDDGLTDEDDGLTDEGDELIDDEPPGMTRTVGTAKTRGFRELGGGSRR